MNIYKHIYVYNYDYGIRFHILVDLIFYNELSTEVLKRRLGVIELDINNDIQAYLKNKPLTHHELSKEDYTDIWNMLYKYSCVVKITSVDEDTNRELFTVCK